MARKRHFESNADRQKAYRRRVAARVRLSKCTSHPAPVTDNLRAEALRRFEAEPTKCYQRHIRELLHEREPHPGLTDYKRAHVSQISTSLAGAFIKRFEWLGTMPHGVLFCYGLWPDDHFHSPKDLLGAVVFCKGANKRALETVAPYDEAVILARGACAMRAGRNGASFLITRATRLAARDHGIFHFIAYSDPEAGERGTIYRALNWKHLGISEQGQHLSFISPTGERISSYEFNKRSDDRFYALGWDGQEAKRRFLLARGWRQEVESRKIRWYYSVHAFRK